MIAWCLIVEQACELNEAMLPNIKGQGLLVSDKKIFKGFPYISIYKTRGPQATGRSPDTATADMQMLCNIFPILSSQLMKRSSFKFLILKKNIYDMTVNGA